MSQHTHTQENRSMFSFIKGETHSLMLALYLLLVVFHFFEHVLQIIQVYVLEWARPESGGLLGLWVPELLKSELLHFAYNGFQLVGFVILIAGFAGPARRWWKIAFALQVWHFIEHAVLIFQAQTGTFLYGAAKPMSLLEFLMPRIELHFIYNVLVFVPTMIAVYLFWRSGAFKLRQSAMNPA